MKVDHERHSSELSEEDIDAYCPNKQILQYVAIFTAQSGKEPSNIRILDFGCGRGLLCVTLTRLGYQAYGVDIDKSAVDEGMQFMEKHGYVKDVLGTIDEQGKTKFENDYFDIIISDQVFEHIEDILTTATEVARLTKPSGWGIHSYPACYLPVEPHIFVPFVHWLPKNKIRQYWIHFFLNFKKKTPWDHLKHMNNKELAAYYFDYLDKQTFYRLPSQVVDVFSELGFSCEQVVVKHPKIIGLKVLSPLLKITPASALCNWLLTHFVQTDLIMVNRV